MDSAALKFRVEPNSDVVFDLTPQYLALPAYKNRNEEGD